MKAEHYGYTTIDLARFMQTSPEKNMTEKQYYFCVKLIENICSFKKISLFSDLIDGILLVRSRSDRDREVKLNPT